MFITNVQKKWLLILHLLFAAVMLGCSVGILILTITAYNTTNSEIAIALYKAMHLLGGMSLRISTLGALISGTLLAVMTKWGLLRFYWIIAKELLSLLSIGIGVIGIYFWSLKGISILEAANSHVNVSFFVNHNQLLTGIILQIVSLVTIFTISVFKPWGERKKADLSK